MNNIITILGPTASGKTALAANLAALIGGEIISADSRQVYRGMDIGTGKDYQDYIVNGIKIPYHLVDIAEPGYEYNVYEFQRDFILAFQQISENEKIPVLCGGTGLYIESVLKGFNFIYVPENEALRKELELLPDTDLIKILAGYRKLHNTTDLTDRNRLIRAIEISEYKKQNPDLKRKQPKIRSINFGVDFAREITRKRITERLKSRLESGMIDEVKQLVENGLKPEQLTFYGLEYRYLTLYVTGEISYDEMFEKLNIAIHQFAKRQMTWFRKMEKNGIFIHWINGELSLQEKVSQIIGLLPKN
ncbi:MAG TPA: tRNA (adenosine(37)-N6)-dimethylallyltransferase MiaA [Bacteroidales bacterium]